jgi:hypothetical protein
MTLILPPPRIFKVLARGSGTDMEPPTEYWRSRFHPSQADKISDSPETRENARAPVRDPRFCVDIGRDPPRLPSLAFAEAAVPGLCILRFVSLSGGRGMEDVTLKDYVQVQHSVILRCAHTPYLCFMWISEQTLIISLYWSVYITATDSVYCAVRISSSNTIQVTLSWSQCNSDSNGCYKMQPPTITWLSRGLSPSLSYAG